MPRRTDPIWDLMGHLFRQHPWHGVPVGEKAPEEVTVYIEMTLNDTVKYELDKTSGLLKVDRPQKFSSVCPSLYGLVPQTYCADKVAEFCNTKVGRTDIVGDKDPLDICVLSEKSINHGDILMTAIPIGGFRMIDGDEADDKILAVMKNDRVYGHIRDIKDLPQPLMDGLRHYFLTYKEPPDFIAARDPKAKNAVEIPHIYGAEEAHEVIRRSQADYQTHFSDLKTMLTQILRHPWLNE